MDYANFVRQAMERTGTRNPDHVRREIRRVKCLPTLTAKMGKSSSGKRSKIRYSTKLMGLKYSGAELDAVVDKLKGA
jgi:hypothetical protein